jgi:hypothetical protein
MTIHDTQLDRSAQPRRGEPQQEVTEILPATRASTLHRVAAAGVVAVGLVATLAWTGFIGWLAFRLLAG